MLTTILTIVLLFFAFKWFQKKRVLNRMQYKKPSWAIGYAQYHLCRLFTYHYGSGSDWVLHLFVNASKQGLPNLNDLSRESQSALVGLKAYANMQGELSKLSEPLTVQSLSQVVAVEARTALQMATARININSYIKTSDPDTSEEDLQNAGEEILTAIQKPILTEDDKHVVHGLLMELLRHFLLQSFARRHGKKFDDFDIQALEKLSAPDTGPDIRTDTAPPD